MESNQEMFNAAWVGLKAQGFEKCVFEFTEKWSPHAFCPWESADRRLRCAIGHANAKFRGRANDIPGEAIYAPFVEALRNCHNTATSPGDMERQLRELAAARGLTIPGTPKGDGFAVFMARVQKPVAVTA